MKQNGYMKSSKKTTKENKKIRGATRITYNGIKFRSKLEVNCYMQLQKTDLHFAYEPEKIILWEGLRLQEVLSYAPKKLRPGKYAAELALQTRPLSNITYTPDFKIVYKNYIIYYDVKGMVNDTYPIKKRMFLKHLEEKQDGYHYIFLEPHNLTQMAKSIEYIYNLK